MTPDDVIDQDDLPIREGSPLLAFLHVLKMAHAELQGKVNADIASARYRTSPTRRHARDYVNEVMPQLLEERERRRQSRRCFK